MSNADFEKRLDGYRAMTEAALDKHFREPTELNKAIRYSLLGGGKRIRAALVLELCHICGGDAKDALPAVCGVEMLHTYSLIHDDLPCMDDDDTRRGKPCVHKVFGETVAVLAGDALQAESFRVILNSALPPEPRASCALALAEAAGVDGICGGQYLDLRHGEITRELINEVHLKKTAALFNAACEMGACCAGAPTETRGLAKAFGQSLGLAFQLRDDMIDAGSDTGVTAMAISSSTECARQLYGLTARAITAANALPQPGFLVWLAGMLAGRND